MDVKEAGTSLDSLVSSFNTRIAELQQLVIARNMYPASSVSDLSAIDAALKGMELQVQNIKNRLRDETRAIPKAKVNLIFIYDFLVVCLLMLLFQKLIEAALQQQKKLETISACVPSCIPERLTHLNQDANKCFNVQREELKQEPGFESLKPEEPAGPAPREKKGRAPPPMWYVTGDELNSVPSYMKQRLTLDKVNAAIGDMATYAEANAQLIAAPRKKLAENNLDKALELREIAMADGVKGKHFFLETDIKGPSLKLDNTGRALLTVLRHLGRISETRIGHHRVIILLRP
ncbi:UNVERIFIED_CONTAM: Spindle and kinetochore-associated protein 1 [Sesamum radiatum]|uniref:SKA complex subunit 1 homolog n=1 Tax=Sesamum radiatum TaxID=300843 RepID=A0AAW2VJ10_SESRA